MICHVSYARRGSALGRSFLCRHFTGASLDVRIDLRRADGGQLCRAEERKQILLNDVSLSAQLLRAEVPSPALLALVLDIARRDRGEGVLSRERLSARQGLLGLANAASENIALVARPGDRRRRRTAAYASQAHRRS